MSRLRVHDGELVELDGQRFIRRIDDSIPNNPKEYLAFEDWYNVKHNIVPEYTQTDLREFCLKSAIKVGIKHVLNPDGTVTFGDVYNLADGSTADTRYTV